MRKGDCFVAPLLAMTEETLWVVTSFSGIIQASSAFIQALFRPVEYTGRYQVEKSLENLKSILEKQMLTQRQQLLNGRKENKGEEMFHVIGRE
jgi:hypothetical protein